MRVRTCHLAAAFLAVAATAVPAADPLEALTDRLSRAACVEVTFLSIIGSQVFATVDTTAGRAVVAADGRYHLFLGEDEYLCDGDSLWSYSAENNQVTVEGVETESGDPGMITLVTQLDEAYDSRIIRPGREYELWRRESDGEGILPDTLMVTLSEDGKTLERIRYYDVNGDPNEIVIRRLSPRDRCPGEAFAPQWPDTVETVRVF